MRIRVHSPDLNICSAASGSFYNLYQNHVADLECDMKMYLSKLSFISSCTESLPNIIGRLDCLVPEFSQVSECGRRCYCGMRAQVDPIMFSQNYLKVKIIELAQVYSIK